MNTNSIKKQLTKKVYGQNEIIYKLIDSIFCNSSQRVSPKSFLFVGKSGLGKTLLVREIANLLYSKTSFIKLDMSEFRDCNSVSKIIGSPPGYVGYNDRNTILERVKLHPYSVLLLDEIEKAHSSVLKLFLQVLDDGVLTSSYGDTVSFRHTLIFMTSNLGCSRENIGFINQDRSLLMENVKNFLGVELLNRLDSVFIFEPFSEKTIEKIIFYKIKNKYPNLSIENSKKIMLDVKKECQYLEFGARKVDKILEQKHQEYSLLT